MISVLGFVRGLAKARNVDEQYGEVERMAARGEATLLVDIGTAIENMGDQIRAERWVLESVFDHILRTLALSPSQTNAAAALQLANLERRNTTQRGHNAIIEARRVAALLAQAQTVETFVTLLDGVSANPIRREIMACWLQELVIRGRSVRARPEVLSFHRKLAASQHPLTSLPLALLGSEAHLSDLLPRASLRGSSAPLPFGPAIEDEGAPRVAAVLGEVRELTAAGEMTAAVSNWVEQSNGKTESRLFQLNSPPRFDASALCGLPLECLAGTSTISCTPIDLRNALSVLFSAAAVGGAYNYGGRAAYGRRDMWTSMAGLGGGDPAGDVGDIEAVAQTCRFLGFCADGEWFHAIAWDLGIACLRSDQRTIAVLAATDTD